MSGFLLLPAARADLRQIWRYTADKWSVDQAEKYILTINAAFAGLADGRLISRPIDSVRPGYHKLAVGAHFIIFRNDDPGSTIVVRVLHQRMDIVAQLGDDS